MDRPNDFPRWADDPPVAPPTTITEPSEPEKNVGFQPGVQAQVSDFTITNVLDNHTYNATVDGLAANYLSDGTATDAEIRAGVRDALNALAISGTATDTGTAVRVTADVAGVAFVPTTTDGANVGIALITANKSNKPIRQFLNWLFNLIYLWLAWLDQTSYSAGLIHPDHALPEGTPPTLGAGLIIAANNFSARVIADGYSVPLTAFPEAGDTFEYAPNTDTYWDLGSDRVWNAEEVPANDPEPSVPAGSTRVYMVRTNATDRTSLVDRRGERVRVGPDDGLDLVSNMRFVAPIDPTSGVTTNADLIAPRVTYLIDAESGTSFQHMVEVDSNSPAHASMRTYAVFVGETRVGIAFVWGARLTSTIGSIWTAEDTVAFKLQHTPGVGTIYSQRTGLTAGATTFADTTWMTTPAANGTRFQLPVLFGMKHSIGVGLSGADANRDAAHEYVRNGARYTLVDADLTAADQNMRQYVTGNALDLGYTTRTFAFNCTWTDATALWTRTIAGDAYVVHVGELGVTQYRHLAADAGTWADEITAGAWETQFTANGGGVSIGGTLSVAGAAALLGLTTTARLKLMTPTATPAIINTLYAGNIVKAWGYLVGDGAGNLNAGASSMFGCTADVNAAGDFEVTLDVAMTSAAYVVLSKPLSIGIGTITVNDNLSACEHIVDEETFIINIAGTTLIAAENMAVRTDLAAMFVVLGFQS